MPSSDLAAPSAFAPASWWRPLAFAAATLVVVLALVAGRVVWFDAYWLFRQTPPWLADTGGSSRLLDRQTRRAKALQALTRSYSIALLGSSTVYHGLDPRDADPSVRDAIFNAGISGILAAELPVMASIVASRSGVERVVLGLDYYMFSRSGGSVQLDRSLATPLGRANALIGSVWSRYALFDSRIGAIADNSDPGTWTRAGFRAVPALSSEITVEHDAIRRRTSTTFRPETLEALDVVLGKLKPRRVDVYLAPVSGAQHRVMADLGLTDDFERWRQAVTQKLATLGVPVLDLVDLGASFPFDPARGSTDAWLDNLHFTPVIGRKVLTAVELRTADKP
jgi:hypothetical protein